jgi:peptide methionine sulfoxide reductase MsrB
MALGAAAATKYPIYCDEAVMAPKAHGTCPRPVQDKLRWNCDQATADRICCFNRHYAEFSGYWLKTTFLAEVDRTKETTYYDSVTGKPLFIAPRGRSFEDFEKESRSHGWPSFRDSEVVWENMRCLSNGEAVSVDGTHLGHNLPDRNGNRYCINLVSVAGREVKG